MSRPVKNLIIQYYQKELGQLEGAVLIDIRGLKSNQANMLRGGLAQKKMRVRVVKNSLVRKALAGTKMEKICQLLDGPTGFVFGGESVVDVARALVEAAKEIENLRFRGALMDGVLYGPEQIEELSRLPTPAEARSQAVTLILSPARRLAGQVRGPGARVAAIIKALQEKKQAA